MSKFIIKVFGKPGCDKCKVLNRRLDSLLGKDEWQDFSKIYCDVETEEGLVEFCNVECINPQRIPAMVVASSGDEEGHALMENPRKGEVDQVCKDSKLYTYLGLQTDYTTGGGVLTPKMLKSVLDEARQAGA